MSLHMSNLKTFNDFVCESWNMHVDKFDTMWLFSYPLQYCTLQYCTLNQPTISDSVSAPVEYSFANMYRTCSHLAKGFC